MCIRRLLLWAIALGSFTAINVDAMHFYLRHEYGDPYGEFVDRGEVIAHVEYDFAYSGVMICPVPQLDTRIGNRITLNFHVLEAGHSEVGTACEQHITRKLGSFSVGEYKVIANLVSADGLSVESKTWVFDVVPIDGRCNRNPLSRPSIVAWLASQEERHALLQRIETDPQFAASLGNPQVGPRGDPNFGGYGLSFDYPPLDDIPLASDRIKQVTGVQAAGTYGEACPVDPGPGPGESYAVRVAEYFSPTLDQYFYTADAGEIAAIDAGRVAGGWLQTGRSFGAYRAICRAGDWSAVYRFEGSSATGTGSHFLTSDRAECFVVQKSDRWSFASVPFMTGARGGDGGCNIWNVPLYRAWRPFGDSAHRLTTDRTIIAEMVAQGWIDEGQVMCVLPAA